MGIQRVTGLLLDPDRKIPTKPSLGGINLKSTSEESVFWTWLESRKPDVLYLAVTSPAAQRACGNILLQLHRKHQEIPALLLVGTQNNPAQKLLLECLEGSTASDFVLYSDVSRGFWQEVEIRTRQVLKRSYVERTQVISHRRRESKVSQDQSQYLVEELHDRHSGRIDASKLADCWGIPLSQVAEILQSKYATIHKTPDAPAIQADLGVLEQIAAALFRLTGSWEKLRMWLNAPNPDLEGKTPLSVLREGHSRTIAQLLEDTLMGQPG